MNLRESYAGTAVAGLGWSDHGERPIDRVAAAGLADPLGMMLWRAKYEGSEGQALEAWRNLVFVLESRYRAENKETCERIVSQCMREYLHASCEICLGRGEMMLEKIRIVCNRCHGVKVKRYSDIDRARSMKISIAKARVLGHKIAWLAGEINRLDAGVNGVLVRQLERQVAAA